MATSVGQFEEHEMEGIEVVENPGSKRQRVLSSYVKMMRIDEQQGKYRETKLLEELVAIEDSKSNFGTATLCLRCHSGTAETTSRAF